MNLLFKKVVSVILVVGMMVFFSAVSFAEGQDGKDSTVLDSNTIENLNARGDNIDDVNIIKKNSLIMGLSRILCKLIYGTSPEGESEPLRQMLSNSIWIEDGELEEDLSPVLHATGPFPQHVHRRQV